MVVPGAAIQRLVSLVAADERVVACATEQDRGPTAVFLIHLVVVLAPAEGPEVAIHVVRGAESVRDDSAELRAQDSVRRVLVADLVSSSGGGDHVIGARPWIYEVEIATAN